MKIGVVIPVGPGRESNLYACLHHLSEQTVKPARVMIVDDGLNIEHGAQPGNLPVTRVRMRKHEPGMEQPRNVGVRLLRDAAPEVTHVWFLDSDVIVAPDALEVMLEQLEEGPQVRILVAPYDWLRPGVRRPLESYHNDPRWPGFREHDPSEVITGDLSAGLACFSGNLVWPIDEFVRVGGFWSEIHHGRCEDGELGLRAVAMDVPISFVGRARGWHLHHSVNTALAIARNKRDVPLLNGRHPWVEQGAVFMVDRDGKAFDVACRGCGQMVPTVAWWEHAESCLNCTRIMVPSPPAPRSY